MPKGATPTPMCGRFTLTTEINPLQAHFPFTAPEGLGPLTPATISTVERTPARLTEGEALRWGLVPPWATTIKTAWVNAPSETVATSGPESRI